MNYYHELNKLIRFYEGIKAFQKNAEEFLTKNNDDNDKNIELRLNLLKSYYINGDFEAIKNHLDNFKNTYDIYNKINEFKLIFRNNIAVNNINNTEDTKDIVGANNINYIKNINGVNRIDNINIDYNISEFINSITSEYYNIIIISYEYLTSIDKNYINEIILTYIEIFRNIDAIADKNYYKFNYTSFLFDLCKYLYEFKEYEKLAFFYNIMNFSKKISDEFNLNKFMHYSLNRDKKNRDKHLNLKNKNKKSENKNKNGDKNENEFKYQYKNENENGNENGVISSTFEEFDEIDEIGNVNYSDNSNVEENKAYNYMNSRFFDILNLWEIRTNNYYTKDEIFFMSALFITNEYIPALINISNYNDYDYICDINSKDKNNIKNNNCLNLNLNNNNKGKGNSNFINRNLIYYNDNYFDGNENIYKNNDIANIIKISYSNALKFFKKAIEFNSCNPNYYYEYAECLKKSGKAKDAETFFKKAFESTL
jgi:hypothetical protein